MDDWESAADAIDEVEVDRWAGEDAEEPVAESWDAEPAAKPKTTAPKQPQGPVLSERKRKQMLDAEKKRKEEEELAAESDPTLKAAKKLQEEKMARERDAALAATLLGVDPADPSYIPPINDRDDGSDIAGGNTLSAEDRAALKSGQSLDDFDYEDDASIDKLAAAIVKKASTMQINARQSQRFLRFLKTITNGVAEVMKLDDVAELKRLVNVKHTDMTNKQKIAQKGKKAAAPNAVPKKANTVKVSSGNSGARNNYDDGADAYDDYDDGDFM